jgi:hypothetical protein
VREPVACAEGGRLLVVWLVEVVGFTWEGRERRRLSLEDPLSRMERLILAFVRPLEIEEVDGLCVVELGVEAGFECFVGSLDGGSKGAIS